MMLADTAIAGNDTYKAYLENELALLEKKANSKKATKTQEENMEIKDSIVSALETIGTPVTVTELQDKVTALAGYSNQKLSSLLRQLVEEGRVSKSVDKKKSYFSIAVAPVTE